MMDIIGNFSQVTKKISNHFVKSKYFLFFRTQILCSRPENNNPTQCLFKTR